MMVDYVINYKLPKKKKKKKKKKKRKKEGEGETAHGSTPGQI